MQAKTIKGNSPAAIHTALTEGKEDGFNPTLAIILLTQMEKAAELRAIFGTNGIAVFGVSTPEKFSDEGMEAADILILLLDIPKAYFQIVLKNYEPDAAFEAARQIGEAGVQAFKNPGFIISSSDTRMSGEELVGGLTETAGSGATIIGGVAGNPEDFSGILFTDMESSARGIIALILDQDKIAISGLAVSGWKPVGTPKKVTKSEGAWIYSIDDEPALNVIKKFLGQDIVNTEKPAIGLLPSDLGYPLQFQRASGSVIMRPLLVWNPTEKSIMVGGDVEEGSSFRFSLPPDFDVIDTVIVSTRGIKETEMPEADALLVFSCVGRLGSFGPLISTEIEGLAATWNKPMIGFFSLGEFGKLSEGVSEFHGTTVSWVALKEK